MANDADGLRPTAQDIDDPADMRAAVLAPWVASAPGFRIGGVRYALGHELLPPRWKKLLLPISNQADALPVIDAALKANEVRIRAVATRLASFKSGQTAAETRTMLADALVASEIWAIKVTPRPAAGTADPTVFAALNGECGTKVDFVFLAQWEGGQYLHGYIPFAKGVVAGNSGMTVATGFDIGQKSGRQLKGLALSASLLDEIDDFAEKTFRGLDLAQAVTAVQAIGAPIPEITKAEADLLDKLIHGEHLRAAIAAWDAAKKPGVPAFTMLPEPWQTVLFSRFFHQGVGAHRTGVMKTFWGSATAGDWPQAIIDLKAYPVTQAWYKTRVAQEAAHLGLASPPPVLKPPVVKPPPPPTLPGVPPVVRMPRPA